MTFSCPKCGKQCERLRGLKSHMTREHGGWTDEELARAVSGESPTDDPRGRMARFMQELPGAERGSEDDASTSATSGEGGAANSPAPAVSEPTVKKIKATPKRLKRLLGSIPKQLLEKNGIELDDDDREALDEAGEFLADVFGMEFAVPEKKTELRWRGWAFVWVGGITALIFLKHRFKEVFEKISEAKNQAEKKDV